MRKINSYVRRGKLGFKLYLILFYVAFLYPFPLEKKGYTNFGHKEVMYEKYSR